MQLLNLCQTFQPEFDFMKSGPKKFLSKFESSTLPEYLNRTELQQYGHDYKTKTLLQKGALALPISK